MFHESMNYDQYTAKYQVELFSPMISQIILFRVPVDAHKNCDVISRMLPAFNFLVNKLQFTLLTIMQVINALVTP